MSKGQSLQEPYLNALRRERIPVSIYLVNGIKLQGQIESFDQFVILLKMSSLVSVIGLSEVVRRANELSVTEYRPLEIYTFLVLEYLVLVLALSAAVRWFERRMGADEQSGAGQTGPAQ